MTKQKNLSALKTRFEVVFIEDGYAEVIVPSIWEQQTFIEKAGSEILNQMYAFEDKKNRPICLIPEVTAIIQEIYRNEWSKSLPKPVRVFYVSRCYRYDRPQSGRYREFTQVGVELLGASVKQGNEEIEKVLKKCLDSVGVIGYTYIPRVTRGLSYYVEDGFEVECQTLGAQKQIAGGGRYDEGIGFAIGLDRLLLAKRASGAIG